MLEEVVNWKRMSENPLDSDSKKISALYFTKHDQKEIYYCEKCNLFFDWKRCKVCYAPLTKKAYLWEKTD